MIAIAVYFVLANALLWGRGTHAQEEIQAICQYRLNCGGEKFVDISGRTWLPDDAYVSPSSVVHLNTNRTAPDTNSVQTMSSVILFSTQRYATRVQRSLVYRLPLTYPGMYELNLHFIEFFEAAALPGGRLFDLLVNGDYRSAIDIGSSVGLRQPLVKRFPVEITQDDGEVTVELIGLVRNPVISGLELLGPYDSSSAIFLAPHHNDERFTHAPKTLIPSENEMDQTLLVAGTPSFALKHIATGDFRPSDLQFSGIANTANHVFRIDRKREDATLKDFEQECAEICSSFENCTGFASRILPTAMYCIGLYTTGPPTSTNTITRSWYHTTRSTLEHNYMKMLPQSAITAQNPDSTEFDVVFQGTTRENQHGPHLVFSSFHSRRDRLFAMEHTSPKACFDHCLFLSECVGIVLYVDPDDVANKCCVGVSDVGVHRGAETVLGSLSFARLGRSVHDKTMLRNTTVHAATETSPSVATEKTSSTGDNDTDTNSSGAGSSADRISGAIIALGCGLILSVCITCWAIFRVKFKDRHSLISNRKDSTSSTSSVPWLWDSFDSILPQRKHRPKQQQDTVGSSAYDAVFNESAEPSRRINMLQHKAVSSQSTVSTVSNNAFDADNVAESSPVAQPGGHRRQAVSPTREYNRLWRHLSSDLGQSSEFDNVVPSPSRRNPFSGTLTVALSAQVPQQQQTCLQRSASEDGNAAYYGAAHVSADDTSGPQTARSADGSDVPILVSVTGNPSLVLLSSTHNGAFQATIRTTECIVLFQVVFTLTLWYCVRRLSRQELQG
eukprot:m.363532 g.363532  ORF g.363532 m.363532 type:complete len:785 (-) comp20802_c0_seq4:2135-4489(-)